MFLKAEHECPTFTMQLKKKIVFLITWIFSIPLGIAGCFLVFFFFNIYFVCCQLQLSSKRKHTIYFFFLIIFWNAHNFGKFQIIETIFSALKTDINMHDSLILINWNTYTSVFDNIFQYGGTSIILFSYTKFKTLATLWLSMNWRGAWLP